MNEWYKEILDRKILANEIANQGLCHPLIPSLNATSKDYIKETTPFQAFLSVLFVVVLAVILYLVVRYT